MSEQVIEQLGEQASETQETAQETKESGPKISAGEEIARKGGWKPEDEHTEGENRPETFVSYELFNERGKWIDRHKAQERRISEMEEGFEKRISNANKLHNQQLDFQKAELVRKRDEAIDDADREAANRYQADIDKIVPVQDEPPVNRTLEQWNTDNAWIMDDTPKAVYAKYRFGNYGAQGLSITEAITRMESDVSREFPASNPNRSNTPSSEGGTKPGGKSSSRDLSWGDLTHDEERQYNAMPGAWTTKKDFLTAVKDVRNEK